MEGWSNEPLRLGWGFETLCASVDEQLGRVKPPVLRSFLQRCGNCRTPALLSCPGREPSRRLTTDGRTPDPPGCGSSPPSSRRPSGGMQPRHPRPARSGRRRRTRESG